MVMKTPGVYIVEKPAFPNSVVQVATAVPAFIGYTEKAMNGNAPLHGTPFRITSVSDYHKYFGGAPDPVFELKAFEPRPSATPADKPYDAKSKADMAAEMPQAVFTPQGPNGPEKYELIQKGNRYTLYSAMRAFFLNGGGTCYVTSIGSYSDDIDSEAMIKAITRLEKEAEPTMVVIPETTRLNRQNSAKVQAEMLKHCGYTMKNRFAILDIHGGYLDERSERGDPVARFREDIGINFLNYGAAYYPWLNSAIYQSRDFTFENIDLKSRNKLISLLKRDVKLDKVITPEILKVGVPQLKGDFTISTTVGGVSQIKTSDIMAEDDMADLGQLTYQIVDAPRDADDTEAAAKLAEAMEGKIVKAAADAKPADVQKADPIYTFTQKDLSAGTIYYVNTPPAPAAGETNAVAKLPEPKAFKFTVTDNEGVQTAEKTIAVMIGNSVLDLADVRDPESKAKADIDVSEGVADEITNIVFVGADEIDVAAELAKNQAVIDARKARDDLDKADPPAKDADKKAADAKIKEAEAAAILAVKDRKVTDFGVGTWSTDAAKTITFTPDPGFSRKETSVRYKLMTKKGNVETLSEAREVKVLLDGVKDEDAPADPMVVTVDKTMRALVPLYTDVMNCMAEYMNVLPPAAAMAGIYTMVDNTRGVWKAPANVSVSAVTGPMVNIDHGQQENLNVSTTGKSINAIRPFVGEGTLVWGARTLDGNSLDWRYINVRRTMIMIEESIRLASKAYVFEPNTANTWVTIRSMIENFLTTVWKAGGLAGASPADAFSVQVGLGETMTPVDILEGKLLITVLVAVTRPAEFIEITFQQQMQKS
jgi:phage tail sheath protein FI